MKLLCFIAAGFFVLLQGCETVPAKSASRKQGIARITFYNKHEDKFGNRIASSKVRRATVGKTLAAESSFPFGTKVWIPALRILGITRPCVVEDRGSAVERRKASHKTTPVFDLYAETKQRMKQWAKLIPAYVPYEIQ